jgi:hypothetical protein
MVTFALLTMLSCCGLQRGQVIPERQVRVSRVEGVCISAANDFPTRLAIVGKYRLYIFGMDGKLRNSYHLLDLKKVVSNEPAEVRPHPSSLPSCIFLSYAASIAL